MKVHACNDTITIKCCDVVSLTIHAESSTSVSQTLSDKPPRMGIYAIEGSGYSYQAMRESMEHATLSFEPTSIVNEGLVYFNEAVPAESGAGSHDSETQYASPSYRVR